MTHFMHSLKNLFMWKKMQVIITYEKQETGFEKFLLLRYLVLEVDIIISYYPNMTLEAQKCVILSFTLNWKAQSL